jgi:hypothetical protein
MSSANLAVLALLWAVVIWRIPTIRQPAWKRAPWTAFTCLAVALTVDLPPVITAIDQAAGIADLAVLVKYLSVVGACTAVLDWVTALTSPTASHRYPGLRHAIAVAVALTLGVLFVIMPRPETTRYTDVETGWIAAAYLWVFYCYLGISLGAAAALFWRARHSQQSGITRPGLRSGLLLLAAGSAAAVAYAVCQAVLLAFRTAHPLPAGITNALLTIAAALEDLSIVLVLAGTVLPAAAVAWQTLRALYTLAVLRPLWQDLVAVTPQVAAGPLANGGTITRTLGHTNLRLIRRVTEIRDSTLQLSRYVADGTVTAARRILADQGWTGTRLEAATEACWLRLAARAVRQGSSPIPDAAHVFPGGVDLAEECTWLCQVAAAYRSPAVIAAATVLSTSPTQAAISVPCQPGHSSAVPDPGAPASRDITSGGAR